MMSHFHVIIFFFSNYILQYHIADIIEYVDEMIGVFFNLTNGLEFEF